jgi:16S rRNA processing protein RimM
MGERSLDWVVVGRIEGAYGVKGWVRVRSFTDPPDNLQNYAPWQLRLARGPRECERLAMRAHGKGYVAQLAGVEDRDAAAALGGVEIEVPRECLEPVTDGEFYWNDLIGLEVETLTGDRLGQVQRMMETGANDVMVVTGERRRLIPFVHGGVVREVDLEAGTIRVDWDPDF